MATTKNLCAQISLDLHQKISDEREVVERQAEVGRPEPEKQPHGEADAGPCEAGSEDGSPQPQEEDDPAALSA